MDKSKEKVRLSREEIIKSLIEEAEKHNADEVMCCMAGHRKDNGKSSYLWGEFLDALKTQKGYVWESNAKGMVDLIEAHPEIFTKIS